MAALPASHTFSDAMPQDIIVSTSAASCNRIPCVKSKTTATGSSALWSSVEVASWALGHGGAGGTFASCIASGVADILTPMKPPQVLEPMSPYLPPGSS